MKIKAALWVWIQAYGAKVLLGQQSGGQRDIRLGSALRTDLKSFFGGTRSRYKSHTFIFSVQPYLDMPQWEFELAINRPGIARAHEVRLTRQDPRSRGAYNLWEHVVTPLRVGAIPKQCIVFLKDHRDRLHVRCLRASDVKHLTPDLAHAINESRGADPPAGIWFADKPFHYVDPVASKRKIQKRLPWFNGERISPKEAKRRGDLAEHYVLGELRKQYKSSRYFVHHIAAEEPLCDHDIEVRETVRNRVILYVEVKATASKPGSPVQISNREWQLRKANVKQHRIYIVYLKSKGKLPPVDVITIPATSYRIDPSRYWLWPVI